MTEATIWEIVQAVIAVIIIVGSFVIIYQDGPHVHDILPIMSLVVGYYFGRLLEKARNSPPPGGQSSTKV